MTNHMIGAVKEFFIKLEKVYKADSKWEKEEVEKVYESISKWNKDKRHWDDYSTAYSWEKEGDLSVLKEWIYKCSKTQQDELRNFFAEVGYMGELFDNYGNIKRPMKVYPQFEYRNEQWEMMDVFDIGKEKYGVGIRRTEKLLPEIHFFSIHRNDELMQIPDKNPIFMLCMLVYSMECRLIDWLPYIVFQELHVKNCEEIKKVFGFTGNDADYILKRQLQMYNLLMPERVYGEVKIKQLLGTKIYRMQFGIDKTEEYRELPLLKYPPSNVYGLNSLYTLDIVKGRHHIRDKEGSMDEYFVLCCGKDPENFFIDLIKIFKVNQKWNYNGGGLELSICEVRAAKELLPEVQERFALRMLSVRGMGLVSNMV